MPYKTWRIGGRYPSYFPAKVFNVLMVSQTNQYHRLRIAIRANEGDDPSRWHIYNGNPDALPVNTDLPKKLRVCWVSFVDQTFYLTEIDVPVSAREQMVIASTYIQDSTGEEITRYNNAIILGFAPGGNVRAWLAGIIGQPWLEFANVSSTHLGNNPAECKNPYNDGKIPEISAEAKAWLKQHGMPPYWQEKKN